MTAVDVTGAPQVAGAAASRPASRARLANDAWEGVLTAHTRLMRQFAQEDVWGDISMREYDVLYTLSKCSTRGGDPTPQRIGDLGEHVLLSQPALSRLVDRLESRGLVKRSRDEDDARSVRIGLTAAGRDAQRAVGRAHGTSVTRTMAAALSPDELRSLISLTRKITEAAS